MNRKIAAGEREIVLASEEVQRNNIQMLVQFSSDTRKAVQEISLQVDALQNKMMELNAQFIETTKQLANLQQEFYSKGTVGYNE